MEVKLIELRDAATFLPVMAIRLNGRNDAERYLLARTGYGDSPGDFVLLFRLQADGSSVNYSKHGWTNRTMFTAHQELKENWNNYETGDVLDVQYILGETDEPKKSEGAS